MTPKEVFDQVGDIRTKFMVRDKGFVSHPGYEPFRQALAELGKERGIRLLKNSASTPYDCMQLAQAGVPGEQILAIAALCFNLER